MKILIFRVRSFLYRKDSLLRLDYYLSSMYKKLSRSYIKSLITSGLVSVNSITTNTCSYKTQSNDLIILRLITPDCTYYSELQDASSDIVFEDKYISVINKIAGITCEGPKNNYNSGNIRRDRIDNQPSNSIGNFNVVHRLDKLTSGLIVIAKTRLSYISLREQFNLRFINRIYQAIVWGGVELPYGEIKSPIARNNTNRHKMAIADKGKLSNTYYHVLKTFSSYMSFVEYKLGTGRTHQIRIHMERLGHPILGDDIYCDPSKRFIVNKTLHGRVSDIVSNYNRYFLHSGYLEFFHPYSGIKVSFRANIPKDFTLIMKKIQFFS